MKAVTKPLPEMAEFFVKENNYLKNLISINSSVLDVGCGNGRTMKFLAPFVQKVVGIDYDAKMIEAAKQNLVGVGNVELMQEDYFKINYSKIFDLVYASYNLLGSSEIMPDQRRELLQKMISETKIGGHTVVSVWSDEGIEFAKKYYPYIGIKVLKIEGNDVMTDHGIFKRFTQEDLKELVEPLGKKFKILDLTNTYYLLDIEN
jgi:SAM-dependent methyltransferase